VKPCEPADTAPSLLQVKRLTQELLAAADVVGVTCTGAAGRELADAAFDMVVIDEGSQASE
jgi:superfamily I DNA and/or RNA helicase